MLSTLLLEINIGFIIRGKFSSKNIIMHANICSCHSENNELLGATCIGPDFLTFSWECPHVNVPKGEYFILIRYVTDFVSPSYL